MARDIILGLIFAIIIILVIQRTTSYLKPGECDAKFTEAMTACMEAPTAPCRDSDCQKKRADDFTSCATNAAQARDACKGQAPVSRPPSSGQELMVAGSARVVPAPTTVQSM